MLTILITVIAIIGWIGCVYYYGKAKENGHLFELSKKYDHPSHYIDLSEYIPGEVEVTINGVKLNKDGSIAKKRGRESNVKTT